MKKHSFVPPRADESGNVLFFILLGIVLFAALSATVANMMHSGSPDAVVSEKDKTLATELMDAMRLTKQKVQEMKISGGCEDTGVSFENSIYTVYAHSPDVAASCKLFNSAGGGLNYYEVNPKALDGAFSGKARYKHWVFTGGMRVQEIGTSETELMAVVFYVRDSVCSAINKTLGLSEVIATDNAQGAAFTGSYTASGTPDLGNENTALQGQSAFCAKTTDGAGDTVNAFFQVLIAR